MEKILNNISFKVKFFIAPMIIITLMTMLFIGSISVILLYEKEITLLHNNSMEVQTINARTEETVYSLILLFILAIIIGALITYIIGQRTVKSIRTLATAVTESNKENAHIDFKSLKRNDELGEIANALAETQKLVKIIQSLYQRQIEREQQLETAKQDAEEALAGAEMALRHAEHQQKEAEKANTAKGDFLANMSHEIRTPMNSILGMSNLLLETKLTPDQQVWTAIIKDSGENLLTIINDILDFSKITAGLLELEPIEFNLERTLESITNMLTLHAQEKNLELLVHCHPDIPEILIADVGRIRQIITNLLSNALKFTENGHVFIEVRVKEEDDNHIRLFFEVHDTGIGIPEDKIDYIFSKFTQAEESTTRKFGGTGLGLAISQELCFLMDGSLSASSELGKGSTFYFDIVAEVKSHNKMRIASNLTGIDLNKRRALLLDDVTINNDILAKYLSGWGIVCDSFTDEDSAYAHLQDETTLPYDFLIIDHVLEQEHGTDFCKRTRQDKTLNSISNDTAFIITTSKQTLDAATLKKSGIDGFLHKPIYPFQLELMLRYLAHSKENDITNSKTINYQFLANLMQEHNGKHVKKEDDYSDKHILVVEDIRVNRMLLSKILSKYNIQPDYAENGKEASDKMQKKKYDLVLMDCQMPIMDGFEATKIQREFETEHNRPRTCIVAVTADAMTGDREKCIGVGMDDYINKPIRTEELDKILSTYLA